MKKLVLTVSALLLGASLSLNAQDPKKEQKATEHKEHKDQKEAEHKEHKEQKEAEHKEHKDQKAAEHKEEHGTKK